MNVRTVAVETNADGEFTYERRLAGIVKGIAVTLGTLTTPDIAITDGVWETEILTVAAVAASDTYQPLVPAVDVDGVAIAGVYTEPAIFGSLKIEVTGGGANMAGTIRFLFL